MHKSATKCNETIGKWCKNKHGASKIIDTLETYQTLAQHTYTYPSPSHGSQKMYSYIRKTYESPLVHVSNHLPGHKSENTEIRCRGSKLLLVVLPQLLHLRHRHNRQQPSKHHCRPKLTVVSKREREERIREGKGKTKDGITQMIVWVPNPFAAFDQSLPKFSFWLQHCLL
jgi:hypothetical protein